VHAASIYTNPKAEFVRIINSTIPFGAVNKPFSFTDASGFYVQTKQHRSVWDAFLTFIIEKNELLDTPIKAKKSAPLIQPSNLATTSKQP
jgi:hypothetical protein